MQRIPSLTGLLAIPGIAYPLSVSGVLRTTASDFFEFALVVVNQTFTQSHFFESAYPESKDAEKAIA